MSLSLVTWVWVVTKWPLNSLAAGKQPTGLQISGGPPWDREAGKSGVHLVTNGLHILAKTRLEGFNALH